MRMKPYIVFMMLILLLRFLRLLSILTASGLFVKSPAPVDQYCFS